MSYKCRPSAETQFVLAVLYPIHYGSVSYHVTTIDRIFFGWPKGSSGPDTVVVWKCAYACLALLFLHITESVHHGWVESSAPPKNIQLKVAQWLESPEHKVLQTSKHKLCINR